MDQNTNSLSGVFERLSSGQRINRASDDAAGLAIASSLNARSRVYAQAIRNVSDGISLLSIADGALSELSGIVTRQRELAEQAANGVYSSQQRQALDNETQALRDEYSRVLASTKFNGRNLFDVDSGAISVQAGYGAQGSLLADFLNIHEGPAGALEGLGTYTDYDRVFGGGTAITTPTFMVGDMNNDGIDDIIAAQGVEIAPNSARAYAMVYLGEDGSTNFTLDASRGISFGYPGTINTIRFSAQLTDVGSDGDLDIEMWAEAETDYFGDISYDSSDGVFTNNFNTGTFSLGAFSDTSPTITNALQNSATGDFNNDGFEDIVTSSGTSIRIRIQNTATSSGGLTGDDITEGSLSLLTAEDALSALDDLATLQNTLSRTRGKVGAIQSRLSSATATLAASRENATAAEARIRNADIAEESAALVRYSIKNNVTAAILAQANTQPRIALDLLKQI